MTTDKTTAFQNTAQDVSNTTFHNALPDGQDKRFGVKGDMKINFAEGKRPTGQNFDRPRDTEFGKRVPAIS